MKLFALLFSVLVALVATCAGLKNDICGLKHSVNGNGKIACRAHRLQFSYDADAGECVPFYYGGCMGNDNRFDTIAECEDQCEE